MHTKILSQVWFPGVHCSVGGGDKTRDLSSITLAWMVQKLHKHTHLRCDIDYLHVMEEEAKKTPWATGPWEESCVSWYRLGGKVPRTPGKYKLDGPTFESVHESVKEREADPECEFRIPDLEHLKIDHFEGVELELRWHKRGNERKL